MRADVLSPDDSNANMFGYLRVDAGWLWKPKRLLIHTAPTAAFPQGPPRENLGHPFEQPGQVR